MTGPEVEHLDDQLPGNVKEKDVNKGMIAFFANNTVAANLMMGFIISLGLFAYSSIPKQMFPNRVAESIDMSLPSLMHLTNHLGIESACCHDKEWLAIGQTCVQFE